MKIKSNFKDYYDYIAHRYGGGDPSICYIRNKVSNAMGINNPCEQISIEFPLKTFSMRYGMKVGSLIVNGTAHIVFATNVYGVPNWKIVTDNNIDEFIKQYNENSFHKVSKEYVGIYHNDSRNEYVKLSQQLNSPIFIIDYNYNNNLYIQNQIPCLKDIGYDKIVSPEQLYQNIEYFICNKIRTNPDIKPPVQVEDIVRLEQHGFDKKISFRHRKIYVRYP